jgi:hypothetical protein
MTNRILLRVIGIAFTFAVGLASSGHAAVPDRDTYGSFMCANEIKPICTAGHPVCVCSDSARNNCVYMCSGN